MVKKYFGRNFFSKHILVKKKYRNLFWSRKFLWKMFLVENCCTKIFSLAKFVWYEFFSKLFSKLFGRFFCPKCFCKRIILSSIFWWKICWQKYFLLLFYLLAKFFVVTFLVEKVLGRNNFFRPTLFGSKNNFGGIYFLVKIFFQDIFRSKLFLFGLESFCQIVLVQKRFCRIFFLV